MTKADRLAVIRASHAARRARCQPTGNPGSFGFYSSRPEAGKVPAWAKVPDAAPADDLRERRVKRPSPLNAIADKWRSVTPR